MKAVMIDPHHKTLLKTITNYINGTGFKLK